MAMNYRKQTPVQSSWDNNPNVNPGSNNSPKTEISRLWTAAHGISSIIEKRLGDQGNKESILLMRALQCVCLLSCGYFTSLGKRQGQPIPLQ
jgi:hypothetical protein